jgi:hypothetical protein
VGAAAAQEPVAVGRDRLHLASAGAATGMKRRGTRSRLAPGCRLWPSNQVGRARLPIPVRRFEPTRRHEDADASRLLTKPRKPRTFHSVIDRNRRQARCEPAGTLNATLRRVCLSRFARPNRRPDVTTQARQRF